MSGLFRQEAMEHQRARLWGDVIIVQPTSYFSLVATFLIVFICIGLFLASQSFTRKESVIGYLSPENGLSNIYADRGGAIDALFVKPGDFVTKGQTLATLALQRRLPSGASSGRELEASIGRELEDIARRFLQLDVSYREEVSALKNRLHGLKAERAGLEDEQAFIENRIELAQKQYDSALELAQKGFATQRMVDERDEALLTLKQQKSTMVREAINLDTSIGQIESNIALRPHQVEESKSALNQRKEALLRQLSEIELSTGYSLIAPQDGYVTSVLVNEGATAIPNAPVVVIRPENSPLVAKLLVPSRAAGLLQVGQKAKIQYDAFPYQRFGVFEGTVKKISSSILTPAEVQTPIPIEEAFYMVDLELGEQAVTLAGEKILLKPGMGLKANIELEQRSLVEWVFDPVLSLKGKL